MPTSGVAVVRSRWGPSACRANVPPTFVDCLRELGRLIQQDHGPTCVAAPQELQTAQKDAADASTKRPPDADEGATSLNATEVLILNTRLKMIQERVAQANKTALEAEKGRDELHNQIDQIEQQIHPKRVRTKKNPRKTPTHPRTTENSQFQEI